MKVHFERPGFMITLPLEDHISNRNEIVARCFCQPLVSWCELTGEQKPYGRRQGGVARSQSQTHIISGYQHVRRAICREIYQGTRNSIYIITVSLLQGRAGAVADPYSAVNYLIARCQRSAPAKVGQGRNSFTTKTHCPFLSPVSH